MGNDIVTHWATHPRSLLHLKFVFDAAHRDKRFEHCIAWMVQEGICTPEGKLLKRYREGFFEPCDRKNGTVPPV